MKCERYQYHLQGYEVDISKWGAHKVEKDGGERCPHLDVLSVKGNGIVGRSLELRWLGMSQQCLVVGASSRVKCYLGIFLFK